MKRLIALIIAAILLISMTACRNNGESDETTGAPSDGTTIGGEVTTEAPETTTPETTALEEPVVLDVTWSQGYVGSSTHATYTNLVNANGGYYSMSDVIHIEKAGTKITFCDDNTDSNGDTAFASAAAYVISSWVQRGHVWAIDLDNPNYAGSGSGDSDIATSSNGTMIYTYVTSKDNEYIRLCYRSGQTSNFIPTKRPVVTAQYTGEIGTALKSEANYELFAQYISEQKAAATNTQLKNLVVNVIGDSYFAGNGLNKDYVWPAILAAKYDITFSNSGVNGSTISDYVTTNNPMVNRYTSMPDNNPDIVIVEGGKNDYNQSVPIGNTTDTVSTTFKGAVNVMIDRIKAKYPNAVIIFVTPWKVGGTNSISNGVQNYTDAMIEVCAARGVPCINASDTAASGVDMTNATFRAQYCMSANDVSHLNLEGHKLVLPFFEAKIAEIYAAAKTGT